MRTAAAAAGAGGGALDRATLRFADVRLEVAFRRYFFGNVIVSVRAAHVLGIAAWVVWGLIIRQYAVGAPEVDLFFRFGVLIPILLVGLVVTMLPFAPRVWEAEVVCVNLLAALVWTIQVTAMEGVPFDLGYVGVIFIMAFSFTLNRLRFVLMAGAGIAMIVLYFGTIVAFGSAEGRQLLLAFFSLASFYVLGMIASYTLQQSSRLLFLREPIGSRNARRWARVGRTTTGYASRTWPRATRRAASLPARASGFDIVSLRGTLPRDRRAGS